MKVVTLKEFVQIQTQQLERDALYDPYHMLPKRETVLNVYNIARISFILFFQVPQNLNLDKSLFLKPGLIPYYLQKESIIPRLAILVN